MEGAIRVAHHRALPAEGGQLGDVRRDIENAYPLDILVRARARADAQQGGQLRHGQDAAAGAAEVDANGGTGSGARVDDD
jgi:hypothetical protein